MSKFYQNANAPLLSGFVFRKHTYSNKFNKNDEQIFPFLLYLQIFICVFLIVPCDMKGKTSTVVGFWSAVFVV